MRYLSLICIIFLLFSNTKQIAAQKIHAIIISDTDDATIGKGCQKNLVRVEKYLNEIKENTKLQLEKHLLVGKDVRDYKINKLVKNLKCTKNDVIFFHYSGHGRNTGRSAWPKLLLKGGYGIELRLDEIHQRLINKEARLVITLGDCCNLGGRLQNNNNATANAANWEKTDMDWKIRQHYTRLFRYSKGNILATGTKAGLAAYFNDSLGGYFSVSFFEALYQTTHYKDTKKVTWDKLLEKAQVFTNETAKSLGKRQTPYFKVKVPHTNKATSEPAIIADNTTQTNYQQTQNSFPQSNIEPTQNLSNNNFSPNNNTFNGVTEANYVIKSGDNLGKIADFFNKKTDKNITIQQIREWNDIKNDRTLQIGQTLTIYVHEKIHVKK